MTPTTYGRDFAYCLKSHGGVRGFNASLWRFLLRCTLFCHSVATFLTSVSSYEGGCGFEDLAKSGAGKLPVVHPHEYPNRPVNRLEYEGGLSDTALRTDYHHSRRGYRIDKLPALARRGSHVPFLHQRPYLRGSSLPSIHRRQEAEIYLHHTSRRHQRRCLHQSLDRRPGRFW